MEAASIDGANAWKRFLNVTIPMISPYIFFVVFLNLNYSFFDLYAVIDNLTEGGPVNATTNLVVDVIRVGVESPRYRKSRGAVYRLVHCGDRPHLHAVPRHGPARHVRG